MIQTKQTKHGISFEEAKQIFAGPVLTFSDKNSDEHGEFREISIGFLSVAVVITVVHTDRNGKVRLISARRANKQERIKYHDYIGKTLG